MAEYITNGSYPYMFLWNPIDLGYLASYAAGALASNKITGNVGDQFGGGKLGNYTVIQAGDGDTEVILVPRPSSLNLPTLTSGRPCINEMDNPQFCWGLLTRGKT
jgi:hypothetical protein